MKELKGFRLRRSIKNVQLSGLLGGLAEDLKIDAALLRNCM